MGQKSISINFSGLLWPLIQVALIVLKLENMITWSWLWVLAPIWGGFALIAIILIFVFMFTCLFTIGKR